MISAFSYQFLFFIISYILGQYNCLTAPFFAEVSVLSPKSERSCICALVYRILLYYVISSIFFLLETFQVFGFSPSWLWAYLIKFIPKTPCVNWIKYLRYYFHIQHNIVLCNRVVIPCFPKAVGAFHDNGEYIWYLLFNSDKINFFF